MSKPKAGLIRSSREKALGLHPLLQPVRPAIHRQAFLAHAEAVSARGEDVQFGLPAAFMGLAMVAVGATALAFWFGHAVGAWSRDTDEKRITEI